MKQAGEEALKPEDLAKEIEKNATELAAAVGGAESLGELEQQKNRLIGKTSRLAELRKAIAEMPKADRPKAGQLLNAAQKKADEIFAARLTELQKSQHSAQLETEALDLTEIVSPLKSGHLHVITQMQRRLEDVFVGMGYKVVEGPEAETEWNNFEALNFPQGHPARDMYDTFYLDYGEPGSTLLRTHTSPVQVRTMMSQKPPIYVVAPGRCYRQDTADATHMPVFHQIEGLVVDEGITFGDLAGTIEEFTKSLFGENFTSRLRPSYFPFTEPSAEFDILIPEGSAMGKGKSKWLEMGGCGMVHPEVFRACGVDTEKYTGFAFGFGIDRLAMLEFGLDDLREFWTGDQRFSEQF